MSSDTQAFSSIRFERWTDAFNCARSLDNWIFRGQGDSSWGLQSSLERETYPIVNDHNDWNHIENWMFRKFKGAAHHYLNHLPGDDELIEWLSLMQHHGATTRLLDFTYSFSVAAYFAAINAKSDFAIWCFSWPCLMKYASEKLSITTEGRLTSYSFHEKMHCHANKYLENQTDDCFIFPVDPKMQNERRAVQQGLFLFPTNPSKSFEENLLGLYEDADYSHVSSSENEEIYDSDKHSNLFSSRHSHVCSKIKLIKIILPRDERFTVFQDLDRMNVHEASLFPGLDGFARSLKRYTIHD